MYRPSEPTQDLVSYLRRELAEISRELVAPVKAIRFVESHVAPEKLADGLTAFADGTDWNPGSGRGVYTYYGGAWNKLG